MTVVIDSPERYAWTFADANILRRRLATGDYALMHEGKTLAVVERKSFAGFGTNLGAIRRCTTSWRISRASVTTFPSSRRSLRTFWIRRVSLEGGPHRSRARRSGRFQPCIQPYELFLRVIGSSQTITLSNSSARAWPARPPLSSRW